MTRYRENCIVLDSYLSNYGRKFKSRHVLFLLHFPAKSYVIPFILLFSIVSIYDLLYKFMNL